MKSSFVLVAIARVPDAADEGGKAKHGSEGDKEEYDAHGFWEMGHYTRPIISRLYGQARKVSYGNPVADAPGKHFVLRRIEDGIRAKGSYHTADLARERETVGLMVLLALLPVCSSLK